MMLSPEERLRVLDHIFLRFDELVAESAGALKIETVAGVYLVAANGAPLMGLAFSKCPYSLSWYKERSLICMASSYNRLPAAAFVEMFDSFPPLPSLSQ